MLSQLTKFAGFFVGAGLTLATVTGAANAAVRFQNVADRPVVLTMRCEDSGQTYRWTVYTNRTLAVSCLNGADRALVKLYTDDGTVISRIVIDGDTYNVGFTYAGYASIEPAS
jgi:hypothetical protein